MTFNELDLDLVKDTQNLIDWSLDYVQPFHKTSQRFDQQFLSNHLNRQTDRQTDRRRWKHNLPGRDNMWRLYAVVVVVQTQVLWSKILLDFCD